MRSFRQAQDDFRPLDPPCGLIIKIISSINARCISFSSDHTRGNSRAYFSQHEFSRQIANNEIA